MLKKNMMLFVGTIVLINFFGIFVAGEPTAVVKTTKGPVQGEIRTSVNSVKYAAFKGIRYAKAPLQNLRFKPPVAVDPWTETLNAVTEGSDCTQFDAATKSIKGSEDCLFLNVFTPVTNLAKPPKKLKSVMVWFYGGGFTTGTSSPSLYNPEYLLENDVVYVAFNYRLGPFGFLSLKHRDATGNAGLKDQVLGLKWVQANIKKFGGNPKNVTIFGQSAGGTSVGSHVLSEASKGLFHAAISMSGVPLNPRSYDTPENALAQAVRFGALLGINSTDKTTLLNAFYQASATDLIAASLKLPNYPAFTPTIEDESIATDVFLSKCSVDKYKTGNYTKVPQMLGFTDQETGFYLGPMWNTLLGVARDAINSYGMKMPDSLAPGSGDDKIDAAISDTSDIIFKAQIDRTRKIYAATNGKPVYYYHVSFNSNRSLHNLLFNNPYQGAAHADDVAYLFYLPAANYSKDPADPIRRTINRVSTMWTNFAKYGNPTPHWVQSHPSIEGLTWPNSGASGRCLNIGNELTVETRQASQWPISQFAQSVQSHSWPVLGQLNGCC